LAKTQKGRGAPFLTTQRLISVRGKNVKIIPFCLALLLLFSLHAEAKDDRNLVVQGSQGGESRVALVIGNSAYRDSPPLANPVNDAEDVANKLRVLGFKVIERLNLSKNDMGSVLQEFSSSLKPGGIALVFYAGHGVQIKGENYFPTVDAVIKNEFDIRAQSLSLHEIMGVLDTAKTRLNLVFLDACRNNPFARSFRDGARGLARVREGDFPSGTIIAYATKEGSVAADGTGHNGLYTSKLLVEMDSHVEIEKSIRRINSAVKKESKGEQEPWMNSSLTDEGDFCFAGCDGAPAPNIQVAQVVHTVPVAPLPPAAPLVDADTELWAEVQVGNSIDDYQAYLDKYPKGKYATLARSRMKKLKAEAADKLKRDNAAAAQAAAQAAADRARQQREEAAQAAAERARQQQETAQATADRARQQREEAAQAAAERIRQRQEAAAARVSQAAAARPAPVVQVARQANEPDMVRIPNTNYEMGKYEVTQGQWKAVMGSNPSKFVDCGDTCPVEQVSWNDIQEFLRKLNAQTGKNYRLPTESEWQTACLAGSQTEYCGGNDLNAVAWYIDNSGSTPHPVGQKQPNAYGLYDMSGNVWEWMQDCWDSSCGARVLRGGSWNNNSLYLRAANRDSGGPSNRGYDSGFRLARTLP
jgi:formylglycine-generating enzyme required for sulfatase activity